VQFTIDLLSTNFILYFIIIIIVLLFLL